MFRTLIVVLLLTQLNTLHAQKKKEVKKHKILSESTVKTIANHTIPVSDTKFDAEGNITEETEYDEDGKFQRLTKYLYDQEGKLLEEQRLDASKVLVDKKIYKYSPTGKKTEELHQSKEGKTIKKSVWKYDAKGLKTEKVTYDGENKIVSVKKTNYKFR
jgi:YD repeat-containing protein